MLSTIFNYIFRLLFCHVLSHSIRNKKRLHFKRKYNLPINWNGIRIRGTNSSTFQLDQSTESIFKILFFIEFN